MNNLQEQKEAARAAWMQARAGNRPLVKLGIDAHLSGLVVVVQHEESSAKAGVKMSPDRLVGMVRGWCREGGAVFACYEAGPLGFGLQRRLAGAGASCMVVRPRSLNAYGLKVKTDRRDAAELCGNLDRYLCGNDEAMAPVAIPSEQEEQRRSLARERDHLARQRRRELQRFRGTCLFHGLALRGEWWRPKRWAEWKEQLVADLAEQGERMLQRIAQLDQDLRVVEGQLSAGLPAERPRGLGELSLALLDREIVQWSRFRRRQEVAAYTGMVPSEHTSGPHVLRGAITKHGHRRVRHLLIEAAWRLVLFQPHYCRVKKWNVVLANPRVSTPVEI